MDDITLLLHRIEYPRFSDSYGHSALHAHFDFSTLARPNQAWKREEEGEEEEENEFQADSKRQERRAKVEKRGKEEDWSSLPAGRLSRDWTTLLVEASFRRLPPTSSVTRGGRRRDKADVSHAGTRFSRDPLRLRNLYFLEVAADLSRISSSSFSLPSKRVGFGVEN